MINRLRLAWQLPSAHCCRTQPAEPLRPLLTELATRYDDAQIAAELLQRAIPNLGSKAPWTAARVRLIRLRLGIHLGRRTSPGWLGTIHPDYEAA